MAVELSGKYVGGFKTELTHGPSGTVIRTAAPVDNNGDGSSFSPTDLVAAALGACMMTIIGIVAERDGLSTEGLSFHCTKHMSSDSPRRIQSIPLIVHMPCGLNQSQRAKLERAALTCPVHHSLYDGMERAVEFQYPDSAPDPV